MLTKAINVQEGDMFRRKNELKFKMVSVKFTLYDGAKVVLIDYNCNRHVIDANEEVHTLITERILDLDDLPF